MQLTKKVKIILAIVITLIALVLVSTYFYKTSPERVIKVKEFQRHLKHKEVRALKTLDEIKKITLNSSSDSLINYPFSDKDISYYVLKDDELVFWSDNQLDISHTTSHEFKEWHFIELPNAYCVIISQSIDNLDFIALITIKYKYPYETNKLRNKFASGFNLNKSIGIIEGNDTDKYAISCGLGVYIFSLVKPETPIYNETWSIIGTIACLIIFIIFLICYAQFPRIIGKKSIDFKTFLLVFICFTLILGILLYFNIPSILLQNRIFDPSIYASGVFLTSTCHLAFFTGFIFSSMFLLFFFVDVKNITSKICQGVLLLSYAVYFLGFCYILKGLVFHSSIELSILRIDDFSFMGIFTHLLLFIWGVGLIMLFFKSRNPFFDNKKIKNVIIIEIFIFALLAIVCLNLFEIKKFLFPVSYLVLTSSFYIIYFFRKHKHNYLFLIFIFYALFIVVNLQELNKEKDIRHYRVLAQNVLTNGYLESDRIADIILEELDSQLSNDKRFKYLMQYDDSIMVAQKHLNDIYFRGFWNKYELQLKSVSNLSEYNSSNLNNFEYMGNRVQQTHFYSFSNSQNSTTYFGVFPTKNDVEKSLFCIIEFSPRRHFKSYSFPDLLMPASTDISTQLNVSIARYDNHSLTSSIGRIDYPSDSYWISEFENSDYSTLSYDEHWHYVYKPNNEKLIVISKQEKFNETSYLQFFFYLSLIYITLCWLLTIIYGVAFKQNVLKTGLTSRFQYTFITLFIISFICIFYFSVNFIKKRYKDIQIETLENKRNYIQEVLQDKFFWQQDLDSTITSQLNFHLQDLSYTFQTDIHVFNNEGVLVGTSQPLIFSHNLISNRMSPEPYFSTNSKSEQYEHIGDLNYLVIYTDFFNGDYLQIGYIAIPQYFSQDEMTEEIENFSSVIIHIYLIINLIGILLTILIGRRLSTPLNILVEKLREMRIGERNEKIDYKINDEIGQLVAQYNDTVDELEQSANLLAQSERESAWKSMARQIAHEINNPLTPMKLSIQLLQRRKNMKDENFDTYFEESTSMLIEQIDSLSRIAKTFSNFARMPEAQYDRIDITITLLSVIRLFDNENEKIEFQYSGIKNGVFVCADSEQLIQVFNNLIKNAIQAIPENRKGKINVDLTESDKSVSISITDNGYGITDENQKKLFTPNFTTKGQGMGLGLAISKGIIEEMGGTITLNTEINIGTTFTIVIPKE